MFNPVAAVNTAIIACCIAGLVSFVIQGIPTITDYYEEFGKGLVKRSIAFWVSICIGYGMLGAGSLLLLIAFPIDFTISILDHKLSYTHHPYIFAIIIGLTLPSVLSSIKSVIKIGNDENATNPLKKFINLAIDWKNNFIDREITKIIKQTIDPYQEEIIMRFSSEELAKVLLYKQYDSRHLGSIKQMIDNINMTWANPNNDERMENEKTKRIMIGFLKRFGVEKFKTTFNEIIAENP